MTSKLMWQHYAVLFRCFFLAHVWMIWMLIVGGVIFLAGVPLYMIWANPVGFIAGGAILSMYIFLNAVSFPDQILSIASSKQIGLLPRIRHTCFWMFVFACAIVSGLIAVLIYLSHRTELIHSNFSIFFLVSALLILNVVVGQKFSHMKGLVFLSFWALPHAYKLLTDVPPIQLAIVCLCVWFVFYHQWLAWRPQKFQPNIFGMSQNQLMEFNKIRAGAGWRLNKNSFDKSNTLVGSILFGRFDGWKSMFLGAVWVFAGLMILISLFFSVSDVERFNRFMAFAGQTHIFIMYYSLAYGMNQILFRNPNKAWLYFHGRREDFFPFLERRFYFAAMVFGLPVLLVHAWVNFLLLDSIIYRELVWITLVYASIAIAFRFYTQLIIYHKTKGSMRWCGWANILLMIIFIVPVITGNVLWVDQKASIIQLAYCVFSVSIVGIFMLRSWARKNWTTVDFVRVKS